MDNKKIGKLIADLRKAKNLTQQDLGDMVGVGFRAVSKWERGITMPDISIINELSKILGITSDELLSGEVKKEIKTTKNKKVSNKIKITISIITIIILIITSTIIYFKNKTYVYDITQIDGADYRIEGQVIYKENEISLIVNKLKFLDNKLSSIIIKNYEYEIYSEEKYMFGYSNDPDSNILEETASIETNFKKFRINYSGEKVIKRKEFVRNKLLLKFKFVDENNKIIIKEVECILY